MGPATLALLPMIGTIASTALSVVGSIQQGNAAAAAGKSEQQQRQKIADEARAKGQRDQIEEIRQGELAQSRALAVGGKSSMLLDQGFGQVMADLGGDADYNARVALADAEFGAQQQEFQGAVARAKGKSAKKASFLKAGGALLSGATSFAGKYDTYQKANTAAALDASSGGIPNRGGMGNMGGSYAPASLY